MQRRASSRYGAGNAVGRADVEAGVAGAAMIVLRCIGRQIERGEDSAEEQPGAELERNQVGVLALPAQPCRFGERLLHHGGGIDEHLDVAAGLFDQPAAKLLQPRLDHLVVIVALGIDRDGAARALFQDRERIAARAVIDAEQHDRAHLRPHRARIAAAVGLGRHPIHVAMGAFGEEGSQPLGGQRDRIRPRHADDVKALRPGGFDKRGLQLSRCQKSRSA